MRSIIQSISFVVVTLLLILPLLSLFEVSMVLRWFFPKGSWARFQLLVVSEALLEGAEVALRVIKPEGVE